MLKFIESDENSGQVKSRFLARRQAPAQRERRELPAAPMRVTRDKRGWQRTLADDNVEHDDAWLVELQLEELRAATQQDSEETDGQHTPAAMSVSSSVDDGINTDESRMESRPGKGDGKRRRPRRLCRMCAVGLAVCVAAPGSITLLLTSVLAGYSLVNYLVSTAGSTLQASQPSSPPMLLPPSLPPSPPSIDLLSSNCSDHHPRPTFCASKLKLGRCTAQSVRRQCALTCNACDDDEAGVPPAMLPEPHLPPMLPPPASPPLLPPRAPPQPAQPPPKPERPPPRPQAPPPPAVCAQLSRMSLITTFCYDDPERKANRTLCESSYYETGRGLVPCAFESGKCQMAALEPVICPDLSHPSRPPPPSPVPASPPPSPQQPIAPALGDLIARFRDAVPSSDLAKAGILIHSFDHTESLALPWRGCPNHQGVPEVDGNDCILFGDRFSASIIFQGRTALFGGSGGIIFRPRFNRIRCSYAGDGGSRSGDGCGDNFCPSDRGAVDGWCDGAPHRPRDLENMLRWWGQHGTSYNEVIVDAAYMDARLPQSIEAFLSDAGGQTASVHRQFLDYYGVNAEDYPLVRFDPGSPEPFSLFKN